MEDKIRLSVLGFSFNQTQSGTYGLILAEDDGARRLIIIIGTPEAQSIAFRLQGSAPPRPLAHDLFQTVTSEFGITLLEVVIYKYDNGVFYSKMRFRQGIQDVEIESRTSDAIAIALRAKAPIYTTKSIMREQAIVFEEGNSSENMQEDEKDNLSLDYSLLNTEELEALLKDAVEGEDYELASLLRDELKKKLGSN